MSIVTVRVDKEMKKRMDQLREVNWSEVLREAIRRRIDLEERLTTHIDRRRALRASRDMEMLRDQTTGRWSGVEEIRRWRQIRR